MDGLMIGEKKIEAREEQSTYTKQLSNIKATGSHDTHASWRRRIVKWISVSFLPRHGGSMTRVPRI